MKIIQCNDSAEMETVARGLQETINAIDTSEAVVLALRGDLGAGKTTLVQALARTLGIVETVTSPTYVVMKSYPLPEAESAENEGQFSTLVHIDAYRIENVDEMRVLRFSELLGQKGTIICVEWPERIASLIPQNAINVLIEIEGTGRRVTIS
jgi:tRNA threonylcarbamoyl adenosine modification protein YjeE